ncbi:hypothetical protein [Streptomyces scabiei]|uniref:hypothetical protein n=1 Tax=Streptomyces scabiei TaxID=1930 RepID=UPI0038F625ED
MAAIPLTSLECTLEAERLLELATRQEGEGSDRAVAMAAVYAQLAHVAALRETTDRE